MDGKRFDVDRILGVRGNEEQGYELVVVNELLSFDGVTMEGATGYSMEFMTQREIDRRNEDDAVKDWLRDIWKEDVRAGVTEKGLDEYVEEYEDDMDSSLLFPGDDPSYRDEADDLYDELPEGKRKMIEGVAGIKGEDYAVFNSASCGRCLCRDGEEWAVVIEPELLRLVNDCEGGKIPVSECESRLLAILGQGQASCASPA